jgi:hypothetical protein
MFLSDLPSYSILTMLSCGRLAKEKASSPDMGVHMRRDTCDVRKVILI